MRGRAFVSFMTLLPLAAAASNLIAVSTLPGFLCVHAQDSRCGLSHPMPIPQSSLPALLHHLASRTAQPNLPIEETSNAPEFVVVVTSRAMVDPTALIGRISSAVDGASSFQATTDRDASDLDLWRLHARSIASLSQLSAMASNNEVDLFKNGVTDVVTIAAMEEDHQLLQTLRVLARRTKGKLAVVWTTREDRVSGDPATGANPEEKQPEELPIGNAEKTMNAPEINSAQLTGLLVTLIFVVIFLLGFICLWNIQPPQSFEIFDSNDVKKKMQ